MELCGRYVAEAGGACRQALWSAVNRQPGARLGLARNRGSDASAAGPGDAAGLTSSTLVPKGRTHEELDIVGLISYS